jgi:hypothetical protein
MNACALDGHAAAAAGAADAIGGVGRPHLPLLPAAATGCCLLHRMCCWGSGCRGSSSFGGYDCRVCCGLLPAGGLFLQALPLDCLLLLQDCLLCGLLLPASKPPKMHHQAGQQRMYDTRIWVGGRPVPCLVWLVPLQHALCTRVTASPSTPHTEATPCTPLQHASLPLNPPPRTHAAPSPPAPLAGLCRPHRLRLPPRRLRLAPLLLLGLLLGLLRLLLGLLALLLLGALLLLRRQARLRGGGVKWGGVG